MVDYRERNFNIRGQGRNNHPINNRSWSSNQNQGRSDDKWSQDNRIQNLNRFNQWRDNRSPSPHDFRSTSSWRNDRRYAESARREDELESRAAESRKENTFRRCDGSGSSDEASASEELERSSPGPFPEYLRSSLRSPSSDSEFCEDPEDVRVRNSQSQPAKDSWVPAYRAAIRTRNNDMDFEPSYVKWSTRDAYKQPEPSWSHRYKHVRQPANRPENRETDKKKVLEFATEIRDELISAMPKKAVQPPGWRRGRPLGQGFVWR